MGSVLSEQERAIVHDLFEVGVLVGGLSSIEWETPHPAAIPVLLRWLHEPIDSRLKVAILVVLGRPWAFPAAYPALRSIFDAMELPMPDSAKSGYDEALVSVVCSASNAILWPDILAIARRDDLGYLRAHLLRRAGRFKSHAEEVLALFEEFVGSDSAAVEMSIADGLRLLGDPRGVATLHRVADLTSHILRSKAKTLDRLRGRD